MASVIHTLRLAVPLLLTITGVVGAQAQDLEPVDEAIEDIGPLSVSLRELQADLREPAGFDRVYRMPGRSDLYMRIHGGLYAVFPQSTYVETRWGAMPVIPSNTVFYFGLPSPELLAQETSGPPAPPVDPYSLRVHGRVDIQPINPGEAGVIRNRSAGRSAHARPEPRITPVRRIDASGPEARGPRIVTDPSYRAKRVHRLIRRAAEAAAQAR